MQLAPKSDRFFFPVALRHQISSDKHAPFPEEFNRRTIALIADYHFAPTVWARENLIKEGVLEECVFVTGNTGIDALRYGVQSSSEEPFESKRLLLLTAHRRENLGEGMRSAFCGIKRALLAHPDVCLIYPMHKNPKVREVAKEVFDRCDQAILTDPMD